MEPRPSVNPGAFKTSPNRAGDTTFVDPSLVRSLEFCQRVSAACSAASVDGAVEAWARAYAFCEDARHARLTMPDPAIPVETRRGVPAPADYWASITPDDSQPLHLGR